MCYQAAREGNFGREQKRDDWLQHCWDKMLHIDGENTNPNQALPVACFLVKNRLLYLHCDYHSKPCNLLIVPHTKIDTVIYLALTHSLGGHLGPLNTLEKVQDQFHLPGMVTEVQNFCQRCPHVRRLLMLHAGYHR